MQVSASRSTISFDAGFRLWRPMEVPQGQCVQAKIESAQTCRFDANRCLGVDSTKDWKADKRRGGNRVAVGLWRKGVEVDGESFGRGRDTDVRGGT